MSVRFGLFGNYLKKMFRNSLRLLLTLSGLVLSVVILMVVLIFSETSLAESMKMIELYQKNNIVVADCEFDYNTYEYYKNNKNYNVRLELSTGTPISIADVEYGDDMSAYVFGRIVQVDSGWSSGFLSAREEYDYDRYSAELLFGRDFTESDVQEGAKVIIIDEITSNLLFGTTNSINEYVSMKVWDSERNPTYMKYKVIGVIENSTYSTQMYEKFVEEIKNGMDRVESIYFNVFVPYTSEPVLINRDGYEMQLVFWDENKDYSDLKQDILSDASREGLAINYAIDADDVYAEAAEEIARMQSLMIKAMIVVFVIVGLSITNTMIFSVKERTNEIGIRKAIGAFNSDILIQFIFEGIIYGVISGVLGILIAIGISSGIFLLAKDWFVGVEKIEISPEAIVISFVVSILVSMVAGIIPALYASKIKIADAIKFD